MKNRSRSLKALLLLFSFLLVIKSNAQSIQWLKKGGGGSDEFSSGIASDEQGNIYTIGTFTGTSVFGTYTLSSAGKGDVFVIKYDALAGTVAWAKRLGSVNEEVGVAITTDPNGEIYCTGRYSGTITLGSTSYTANGPYEGFVARLDPATGNVSWAATIGGPGYDSSNGIATDLLGNVFITGYFQGTATFGANTLTPIGTNQNMFVAGIDPTGTVLWAKTMGGMGYTFGNSISSDALGNVYVAGSMEGSTTFGTYTLSSNGNTDMFMLKMDAANGNVLWAKNFGGTGNDNATSILSKAGGEVFMTGRFENVVVFGTATVASNGSSDAFSLKLDAQGNLAWAQGMGGSGYDTGNSITYDAKGNVFTTGQFSGVLNVADQSFFGQGAADGYVMRRSEATGLPSWALQVGSQGADVGAGITRDVQGDIYVTGSFQLNCTFETMSLTSTGISDVFVMKIGAKLVGIEEQNPVVQVKVFPNPVSDQLSISLEDAAQRYEATLTDVSGRTLKAFTVQAPEQIVDVSALAPGIYCLGIYKDNRVLHRQQIVKE